ncbi:MAG: hypothetical protein U0R76_02395 [Candidatus Nanopelagicales bacterium]
MFSNLAVTSTVSLESITSIVFDRFAGSTPITTAVTSASRR